MNLKTSAPNSTLNNDPRVIQLYDWFSRDLNESISSLEFASEDASFRRYFRVILSNQSYIVMDAPVDRSEFEAYIRIAKKFQEIGLNVPEVLASNYENGFALITDFGKMTFLQKLSDDSADQLYSDALGSLIQLQEATATDPNFLPPYDRRLLMSEMRLLRDWHLVEHCRFVINSEIDEILTQTFEYLCEKALEQPKVWVHLDYHSRNLMVVPENNPGILDFQSAVNGPITYDLVSLLRDCYIVWPQDRVEFWIRQYLLKARSRGVDVGVDKKQFTEWFDLMGLQRHIKVVGIFSRLNYRDGKPKFLEVIPTVLAYIESVSRNYKKLKDLHSLVTKLINHVR